MIQSYAAADMRLFAMMMIGGAATSGMAVRLLVLFLALYYCVLVFPVDAFTEPADVTALHTISDNWKDVLSATWSGSDPCSSNWLGVSCTDGTVTGLDLRGRGLAGPVPAAIGGLTNLSILDLSRNAFTGWVPSSFNRLSNLQRLYLSQNHLSGPVPAAIEGLSKLTFLDLYQNNLSGIIPPQIGNLTLLTSLDLSRNAFTGWVPSSFNRLSNLQRLSLSGNNLNGIIPPQIGNLTLLTLLGLSRNAFTGWVPSSFNRLSNLQVLYAHQNLLDRPFPDLSNLTVLIILNLSSNDFSGPLPLSFKNFVQLMELSLQNNSLSGPLPDLSGLVNLLTWKLDSNQFNGTLDISKVNAKALLSIEDNQISDLSGTGTEFFQLKLGGNPICESFTFQLPNMCDRISGYGPRTWQHDVPCAKLACHLGQLLSPQNCTCTYPLTSKILLISPSFSTFNAPRIGGLVHQLALQMSVDSDTVWIQSANFTSSNQTLVEILVFPHDTGFWDDSQLSFIETHLRSGKYLNGNVIKSHPRTLRIVLGVMIPVIAILIATLIAVFSWRRYKNKEFMLRYGVQQAFAKHSLKPVFFTYHDLKMITNDFSQSNKLGKGGFGEVFRGVLPDGTKVAVKRLYALRSLQGTHEFINEVTIITGVLHRNLVKLIGCCVEETERMLIYEFLEHNSLYHELFGSSNVPILDWPSRYNIAIGTARGLAYLHHDSDTRIIHRDIKASNILLDKNFQPKIGDFGLARLFPDGTSHVSTRVAGTFGYVAPEYGRYGQLTEKADVFSFGVVLLELVSGKKCITFGEDYVLLLEWAWQLYKENRLMELVDPRLISTLKEVEAKKVIHVALLCTHTMATKRPTMPQVIAILVGERDVQDIPIIPGEISELTIEKSRSSSSLEVIHEGP